MSVTDLLNLADDKLRDVFHMRPRDPAKAREKAIKKIGGKRRAKEANGITRYESPFPVGGKTEHFVPSERFSDFITKLKNLVTEGHFDTEIEESERSGTSHVGHVSDGRATYIAEPRKKRAPMSEEAKAAMKAKRLATMKANGTKPGRQKA